ncbi:MAG: 3'-5' exonuclease, partial [Candidatus Binataceae bacterium]
MDSLLAIYPTARKVEEELKRRSRDGCVMGHRIVTFPQLIETLWRESDSPPRMIDAIGERIALNQALSTSGAGGFPRFANGSVGDNGGLAACIGGLIRQLKSAAVTPMDLRDAARPLAAADRRRVEMVAEAFAAYEDLLRDRGLADAHDRERIVLEGLHQAERSGRRPRPLEGVKQLLIAEIYDLSLLQFMIVASLIRLIGDADLTIQAASHKVDANGFANLTWNRFVGEESIADKVLPHFVHRGGREGQLGFVLEHMFTDSYPAAPPADGTVTIVGAPDRLREAEEVARAIRRMLEANGAESADGSVRFERIGVVARDLQPYANYLETVFRRYRIPLRIEGTRSLRASALGRIVMDLLKLPAEGYRRVAIVALCNSPCLALGIRGGDQRLLAEIGYIDAAAGNIADRFAIAKSAAEAEAAEAGNDAARQRALRQNQRLERAAGAFARLIALCAPLEQPATAAEHAARLDHLLEELSFDPAAGDDGNAAGAALRETFDAITRASIAIAPATLITPAAFAGLLEEAMTQKMLEADCGGGEVAAMPVLDARGLDFDCVFILGLNEGTFPRYHGDDPIISDDIRPALNRTLAGSLRQRFGAYAASAPGPLLRTRRHHNAEDWFLFFLALSMPERRAVLSYAAGDERGNPIARSPFIDEVTALCGG